jgi:hypothetical protein
MLIDVFEAIAFTPDALRRCAIEQAQDRLFDEVLAQYSALLGTAISIFIPIESKPVYAGN